MAYPRIAGKIFPDKPQLTVIGNHPYAHLARRDIKPAPRRSARCAPNCSLPLLCILGFLKSAAKRSTRDMYIRIPAEAALKMPWMIRAVELVSS